MKIPSKKTNIIKKSIHLPLNTLNDNKQKFTNNKNETLIKYDKIPLKNNTKNDKEKEKEEFGYELDQSYDKELNLIKENKAKSTHQKSNGEDLKKYADKINNKNINKDLKLFNKEFLNNKNNNNINIDLGENLLENKKIKKTLILQQILLEEMKKEMENLKKEKKNLIKEFDIEKKNLIEKYEMKIKNIITEKNELLKNKTIIKEEIINIDNGNKYPENVSNYLNVSEEEYQIINMTYEIIKQSSDRIKIILKNNHLKSEEIIPTSNFKNYFEHINIDNNGNISLHDKLLAINEFNNIINSEINFLLDKAKNNIFDIKYKRNMNKNVNNNSQNLSNNIFNSENGQNNWINDDKNKIFKKIDAIINKNRFAAPINYNNYMSKSKILINDKNRMNILNRSRAQNINSININSNLIHLKKSLFEKNSIVYKSNLSPKNNNSLNLYVSNNENFSSKYNKLINILNDNENNSKLIKTKNLKTIELNNVTTKNTISNKILNKDNNNLAETPFFKNIKRTKIPLTDNLRVNNTANINKMKDDLLSSNNITSKRNNINYNPIYQNDSGGNSINHLNHTFDKISFLPSFKTNNIKRKIPQNSNLNNKKVERNKINKLDFHKTDIKGNEEYIKINDIFKNSNNSNELSKSNKIQSNKSENESFQNEENKYEKEKGNINTNRKFFQKIFLNQKLLKKQIIGDINGLSNDIINSTFSKNNISKNLNNNNSTKGNDKLDINNIEKIDFNYKHKILKKIEKIE